MKRSLTISLMVLLMAAPADLLLSGCGGGDEQKKPTSGKRPTRGARRTGGGAPNVPPPVNVGVNTGGSSGGVMGPGETADYTPGKVDNGGSLTVQVNWTGDAKAMSELKDFPTKGVNADVCKCAEPGVGPNMIQNNRLVINADKSVQGTLVYLSDITAGKDWASDWQPPLVDQKGCEYYPLISIARQGKPVNVRSDDPTQHTVMFIPYGKDDSAAVDNLNFDAKSEGKIQQENKLTPGLYELKCQAGHTWMDAYIMMSRNPYVGVTDAKGQVTFTDVPAGTYTLVVMHPNWNFTTLPQDKGADSFIFPKMMQVEQSVEVKAGAAATTVAVEMDEAGLSAKMASAQ
ncbi:MAG: hypothetical protein BIFFINMI_04010 [Phycisphaerae bacterium]|nr:hypothetical protein [Phycisphaerae bacterium]